MARRAPAPADRLLSEELGRLLFRGRRLLWTTAAARLEARGESMLAWQLLSHLHRWGPATQREIADRTAQHTTGVSRLLDELERGGFVRRTRDPSDRRKLQVQITPRGVARVEGSRPGVFGAVEEVLRPLQQEERRQLRALLEKLVAD
jgi:MarR family 2-MHQ and catechol resistance regulon transcriptional repressor